MKYTICTVVNDPYLEFLYYFTKTALEKCTNLDKLVILYTGNEFKKDPIFEDSRIKIIKYFFPIPTVKLWDAGWLKNVELKTKLLRDLATDSNYSDQPIFLIDVDCYFLREFIDTIDQSKDVVVTKRKYNHPYIASFVGLINPKSCLEFIDVWRNIMGSIQNAPKETPALCQTVSIIKKKLNVQEIPDTTISCVNFQSPPAEARILHFKGCSIGDATDLIKKRLQNLKSII